MGEGHAKDAPLVIESNLVFDAKIMALAGDDHVVIAVIAHLAGPSRQARGHRTGHRQRVALAFLAAKAATHAPGFDAHPVKGHGQCLGHLVLDLAGMLGRGMHQHVAVFLRQGQCDLAFQIEMFLPAHFQRSADPVRGRGDGAVRVALEELQGFLETAVGLDRVIDA